MENQNPVSIDRAHRHFIVDEEVAVNLQPAQTSRNPPVQNMVDSITASIGNTFGRLGLPQRTRNPSVIVREAQESALTRCEQPGCH